MLGPLLKGIVVPHIDFIGSVRADMEQMLFENVLCNPVVRQRRDPETGSHSPSAYDTGYEDPSNAHAASSYPLTVSLQPVQHMGVTISADSSPVSYIEALIKACIKPPCGMAFGKEEKETV